MGARAEPRCFWGYLDSLVDYLGTGSGEALDMGCGEGRVSRVLKSGGYRVTAVDPVAELLRAAQQANSAHDYVTAVVGKLPFEERRFDLVVAYNVLMDVDDLPGAVKEIRRVLRPSGMFFMSIVHPIADLHLLSAKQSYFSTRRFESTVESNGLRMHFAGWVRPLEAYAAVLEDAGLAIASLREPVPNIGEGRDHQKQWMGLPLFLWLKAKVLSV